MKTHNGARTPKTFIVYVMPRPSLLLYITFVNTFSSDKNIFSKDKKVIVWKLLFFPFILLELPKRSKVPIVGKSFRFTLFWSFDH